MTGPGSPDRAPRAAPTWGGAWTLYLDQRITRRKFYAFVVDPDGIIQFRGRRASHAFEWLDAEGVRSYKIVTDELEISIEHLGSQQVERVV